MFKKEKKVMEVEKKEKKSPSLSESEKEKRKITIQKFIVEAKEEKPKEEKQKPIIKEEKKEEEVVLKKEAVKEQAGKEKKVVSDGQVYHIVKRAEDSLWEIKLAQGKGAAGKAIKTFKTKVEAEEYANKLAENTGRKVLVHASKGASKGKIQ